MFKSKKQGIIFGLIMSYSMAFGMEIYNVAIKFEAFKECLYMGMFVFLFSNLWGNRAGARFAAKHSNPQKDNPYFCQLLRQGGTVAVMCPTMSMLATVLFNVILGGTSWFQLPAIWVGTLFKNCPMAFFWNFFAAAPFSHWAFSMIFRAHHKQKDAI